MSRASFLFASRKQYHNKFKKGTQNSDVRTSHPAERWVLWFCHLFINGFNARLHAPKGTRRIQLCVIDCYIIDCNWLYSAMDWEAIHPYLVTKAMITQMSQPKFWQAHMEAGQNNKSGHQTLKGKLVVSPAVSPGFIYQGEVTLSQRCWQRWDQFASRDHRMTQCPDNTALWVRGACEFTTLTWQLSGGRL